MKRGRIVVALYDIGYILVSRVNHNCAHAERPTCFENIHYQMENKHGYPDLRCHSWTQPTIAVLNFSRKFNFPNSSKLLGVSWKTHSPKL